MIMAWLGCLQGYSCIVAAGLVPFIRPNQMYKMDPVDATVTFEGDEEGPGDIEMKV
jgi:hypothetical protein